MSSTPPKKHSDQIIDWLVDLGFTHCFFVAGGNIMHLLDGVRSRMTCVPVVHEVAAGIAVEYFNECAVENRAFALVTAGPGVSNIVTAISGAWLESRELLVIAGQVKTSDLASGGIRQRGIQEIDGVGLTQAISKQTRRLESPISREEFMGLVEDGRSGRPGPIFVEVCLDVQAAAPVFSGYQPVQNTVLGDSVKTVDILEKIRLASENLAQSSRPILLIGGGVSRGLMTDLYSSLVGSGIPVMTTWNGADRIDSQHPNYLGRPNTWGQRSANLILAQADLIIAVGARLGLQQTGFNWQEFGKNAFIVHVDIDAAELVKGHPRVDLGICCGADVFMEQLLVGPFGDWQSWVAYGQSIREVLPLNDPKNETGEGYISPFIFFEEISAIAQADDILIPCSSGGANSAAMQSLVQKRGQYIVTSKGLASMGYGLAGAIGASMAHPRRRTFLFEGDGGFAQNMQELATVRVNNLPLKIFIFANNGYASIRMTQKNYFGGAYLGCDIDTGLGFPDWSKLFESFGIRVTTLDTNWSTNSEVLKSINSSEAAAFIIPTDPLQTYWPKIASRIVDGGSMESNPLHLMSPELDPLTYQSVSKYIRP